MFCRISICAIALIIVSCSGRKEITMQESGSSPEVWKEMDDFHEVMAETFHPYQDSMNLEPVKTRATELVTAAGRWVDAAIPERVDNPEVKSKLQQLKSEAEALVASVQAANDTEIGQRLNQLHNTFHAIQEEWYDN